MTEYNNYILMSDQLTRERSGLQEYSQAASLLKIYESQTAKSPYYCKRVKRRAQRWLWRKRDAA